MLPTFELVSQTAAGRYAFGARSVAGEYVGRLLTRDVPSLERGELEIVAIARRPGVLTKVAIHQPDGLGMGIGADHIARVRAQLDREQIQIVPWRREPRRYIAAALGLSDVPPMLLKPAIEHAQVFVGEIDLRGMDGWRGINRLLASSLTGWRIRLSPIAVDAWLASAGAGDGGAASIARDGARTFEPRLAGRGRRAVCGAGGVSGSATLRRDRSAGVRAHGC